MSQTVLITGASSGFGQACARKFAASGSSLILMARRGERLRQLQEELSTQCRVHTVAVDVRDAAAVEDALAALPPDFQDIDILVNNAGLALGLGPVHEASLEDWETMIDTNIKALVCITRLILPGMVSRNRGHIVNIGSTAGNWPYPGGNVYGASKSFVKQFSRGLRADLLGRQIRVTNIEPGMAQTEFSDVRFGQDAARAARVYEGTQPLSAEDIADIIHWVCSVPSHVNINSLEVMPVCQAWGPFAVNRTIDS